MVGERAPDFEALDQNGQRVRLSDLRGRWVVLYFYPKDDTPGCTTEALGFEELRDELEAEGAVVVGVSRDSPETHRRFCQKYNLNFTLLADEDGKIGELFGVSTSKNHKRVTFLIDPTGRVVYVWEKVKPKGHASEVLAKIKELK